MFCKIHRKAHVKEALSQAFSCEFCKISKNNFLIEHLRWLLLTVVIKNTCNQTKNLFYWNSYLAIVFFIKNVLLSSCFKISFYDDNVNQMGFNERSNLKTCLIISIDQRTVLLNITFQTILKESYGSLNILDRRVKLKNKTPFRRKILTIFANNIELINY